MIMITFGSSTHVFRHDDFMIVFKHVGKGWMELECLCKTKYIFQVHTEICAALFVTFVTLYLSTL